MISQTKVKGELIESVHYIIDGGNKLFSLSYSVEFSNPNRNERFLEKMIRSFRIL